MKITAVIPARYASTRFPGKALAEIDGRPMIQHVYERAAQSKLVGRVIVATDDHRIADAVSAIGGAVVDVVMGPYGASIWVRLAAAIRKRCGGRVRDQDRRDSFRRQAIFDSHF